MSIPSHKFDTRIEIIPIQDKGTRSHTLNIMPTLDKGPTSSIAFDFFKWMEWI